MVAYTVFPFKPSGVAPVFISIDQDDDAAAAAEALNLLQDHASATRVTLWRDDEMVFEGLSKACLLKLAQGRSQDMCCPALSSATGVCPPGCRA